MTRLEAILLPAGPLFYLLAVGGMFARKRMKHGEEPRKRRQAVGEAITILRRFDETCKTAPNSAGNVLCTAIRKYIANRFGSVEAAITPADARRLLNEKGVDVGAVEGLCDILERNFNSAYSTTPANIENINRDCRKTLQLIEDIESKLTSKAPKAESNRGHISINLLFFILTIFCLSSYAALADSPVEFQFLWNEANSRMASASSPEDFKAAATVYRKLVDAGVRNGPVFYNMGTALLMSRQHDQAIKAFTRAERYAGSNDDIEHNMLLAVRSRDKDPNASLPWYRVPLFWHYQLSTSSRITIAVVVYTCFWLALIMRALGSTRVYKPVLSVSMILLIVVGSSAATSIHQEEKDARLDSRITLVQQNQLNMDKEAATNSLPAARQGVRP